MENFDQPKITPEQQEPAKAGEGKIAYRFETPIYPGNIVYVNLVDNYKCVNDCEFCSRPRTQEDVGKPNIYEQKAGTSLHLKKSPSTEQVMQALESEMRDDDQEVAIIGLGEPLIHLQKVAEVIKQIKEKYDKKTRLDTNGLAKCIHPDKDSAKLLKEAGLDEIRISLNATDEEEYRNLCKPKYKNAFDKLLEFIRECQDLGIDTHVSFVINFESDNVASKSRQDYEDFAISLGIEPDHIIFREYVKPV
ncbi:radical SAM protein [Candidatus Kuenenbacteria bacterium]|nr:radical SAM protein [Candidatus Kuenenbacteria bacterium]